MIRHYTTKESPTKYCPSCKTRKPRNEFYNHKRNPSGLSSQCKICIRKDRAKPEKKIIIRKWLKDNANWVRERRKDWHTNLRNKFLEMYGKVCLCCGETETIFLVIDHINGQRGHKRETSDQAYSKAIKEYRPDLYRVLCHNCNYAYIRGICPHQRNNHE